MISDSKKQELATKYIFKNTFKSKDVDKLKLQELFFLIKSCELFKSEEGFDADVLNERMSLFEDCIKDKLNKLDSIYVLYDNATSYPFYDEMNAVELFTSKEYAERALVFYTSTQSRNLKLVSYEHKHQSDLFSEINRLGLKNVLIDKGQFSYQFSIDELIVLKSDDEQIPHMCQTMMEACIKFFTQIRWNVNYKGKEALLDTYQSEMFNEIRNAKFLVPIKRLDNEESNTEVTLHFAKIISKQNGLCYLPIFSDWIEVEKIYEKTEYDALVMNFDDITQLFMKNQYDGVLLNAGGINFVMNSNLINTIQSNIV